MYVCNASWAVSFFSLSESLNFTRLAVEYLRELSVSYSWGISVFSGVYLLMDTNREMERGSVVSFLCYPSTNKYQESEDGSDEGLAL